MFTHLLQIVSFKSKPQNFKGSWLIIIVIGLLLVGVQGYALSLTPGNDMIRMMVASLLKVVVVSVILAMWIKSVEAWPHITSTILVILFVSLLTEVFKLPLAMMIRDAKETSDTAIAIIMSLPLLAFIVWQYAVWYYTLKEVSARTKLEVITIIIVIVLVSEVAGSVFSQIGTPIAEFG